MVRRSLNFSGRKSCISSEKSIVSWYILNELALFSTRFNQLLLRQSDPGDRAPSLSPLVRPVAHKSSKGNREIARNITRSRKYTCTGLKQLNSFSFYYFDLGFICSFQVLRENNDVLKSKLFLKATNFCTGPIWKFF